MSGVTGVILAGGASRRMGRDKALLVWQGRTLLSRTVDCLSSLCDEIIVVGPERDIQLTPGARFITDIRPNCGPLGGLYTGMFQARNSAVLVLACDLPYVHPGALTCLLDLLDDLSSAGLQGESPTGRFDAVVPVWNGRMHPLHAVYRRSAVDVAEEHLRRGRHRMDDFCHDLHTLYATADLFAAVEPSMITLTNVNTAQEYESLLALPAPQSAI